MIETLLAAPVIVKVLAALLLILVVNSFCKHLTVSVAVAALVLGIWCGHSWSGMARIAWERFASADSFLLMLLVLQVIWLSSQMSATGMMDDLVAAVRARVSQRGAMAVLPAVIGLLPMPGGALFSAPLVDSSDSGATSAGLKAQTNHWFRHVWEYWWPLYPGVLLAMQLTRLEVWQFMLVGVPLSLCAIAAGWFFLLRRIGRGAAATAAAQPGRSAGFLRLAVPFVVIVGCYTAVRVGYAAMARARVGLPEMNSYVPIVIGIYWAMAVLQRQRPLGRSQWREIIFSRRALSMAVVVAVVQVYGAFIQSNLPGGQPLVARMRWEMAEWGIPLLAIAMIVPLVSGLGTGLSVGFVGASFPIVLSLLGKDPSLGALLYTTALAYGFGFIGMLLSPVHVCLVVCSEHFHTRVVGNIVGMLKPAAAVLAFTVAFSLALKWLLP